MEHHLAEFNIARLRTPLDSAENAEFVSVLDAVNQIAEVSPGYVWRLTDLDAKSSSYVKVFDDPLLIANYSVWTDLDALRHFTYRSAHGAYLRRRREWFEVGSTRLVCWWIASGEIPSIEEAKARIAHLEAHGPTPHAFTVAVPFAADGAPITTSGARQR